MQDAHISLKKNSTKTNGVTFLDETMGTHK